MKLTRKKEIWGGC